MVCFRYNNIFNNLYLLTTTCDHNIISFNIENESQKIPNSKVVSYNFKKADFKRINKNLSKIDWTSLFNKSKTLQHFND